MGMEFEWDLGGMFGERRGFKKECTRKVHERRKAKQKKLPLARGAFSCLVSCRCGTYRQPGNRVVHRRLVSSEENPKLVSIGNAGAGQADTWAKCEVASVEKNGGVFHD